MSLLAPWLLFPAILALLALGCGLLLERASGIRLPGPLLAPAGVAVMIVTAGFTTLSAATATLTVPTVVGLSVAGLACGAGRRRLRGAVLPFAAAALVFSAYAAPVVMSGRATFAGYIKLDDTATFLALTDRVMEHGHSLAGLAPSSYEATLAVNLAHGYPVGALLPFGIGRALSGVDGAWVYQPYLAFLAAMLALVLLELAGRVVRSTPLRAAAAIVAAQPALLYGFSLWGGIKELAAGPLIALVAALAPISAAELSKPRRLLPAGFALAAVLGVLSVGGLIWLLVPAALVLVVAVHSRQAAVHAGICAGAVLILALPTLLDARSFLSPATETAVRSSTVLGNLVRPLDKLQIFGVWPTGDFRLEPSDRTAAWILIAVVAAAAVVGSALALQVRASGLLLYVGSAIVGCALVGVLASPWVVAKAYAIASPAFVLAAVVGCAGLVSRRRATEGILVLVVIAGGVLWSNALAYHDVNLAPRQQLLELERIGERFAGEGPALMTEYQPYGVRHFLRRLDAEGASELRRRPIPLRNGTVLGKGAYAELAEFDETAIGAYRLLVLRRSPRSSRPPTRYQLVWRGRFYDVWQSVQEAVADARGDCGDTRTLAARGGDPTVLDLKGVVRGNVGNVIRLSRAGHYSLWVGGSLRNRLAVRIDERAVGVLSNQLNNGGMYTLIGSRTLSAGRHVVDLRYSAATLAPGSGGAEYGLGPLVLRLESASGRAVRPCRDTTG